MVRNLILGIVIVMLCSLALLSCSGGLTPTAPNIPNDNMPPNSPRNLQAMAWSYPTPTRIHLQWDYNTEEDMSGYEVYRYSVRHNISDYSTLAQSVTPYVASLIDQVVSEASIDSNFVLYGTVGKNLHTFDDWGIKPKYIYGYKVKAFDVWGDVSDASDVAFSATP
jgi:hypothetical protein